MTIHNRPVAFLVVRPKKTVSELHYFILFLGSVVKGDSLLYMNESKIEITLKDWLQFKVDLNLQLTDTKETDLNEISIYTQTL